MATRSKRFEYAASVDPDGTMRAEGAAAVSTPPGWTPDHLVLAALARCSLGSLRHHADRAGLAVEGGGTARGTVSRREVDGRFAMVEAEVAMDVRIEPPPAADDLRELLAKAERDCFVGASLRIRPRYSWTVNGAPVAAATRAV
jgi:organic hydroperoxide reductase OsmC/OhrA